MREIGGYFGLLENSDRSYYPQAVAVNSGRNAIRYILRNYRIKEIYLPYYTCPVVWDAVRDEGCVVHFYHLDENFLPAEPIDRDAAILYTNYFGLCKNQILTMAEQYENLIVDNAQGFYMRPYGIGSCYSPRKFFGVPDGGYAVTAERQHLCLTQDRSSGRLEHLWRRLEDGANAGYELFQKNDASLEHQPVLKMSNITRTLLSGVDYDAAAEKRVENFRILAGLLDRKNLIHFELADQIPMYYPFRCRAIGLREFLASHQIYMARCWKNSDRFYRESERLEYDLVNEIYPLIIDQRYNREDMIRQVEVIHEAVGA